MARVYGLLSLVILILGGVWIWSPANIEAPGESPQSVADRAATDAIVAEERLFCHDPRVTPSYTVQLGACLPGGREVTYIEYSDAKKK